MLYSNKIQILFCVPIFFLTIIGSIVVFGGAAGALVGVWVGSLLSFFLLIFFDRITYENQPKEARHERTRRRVRDLLRTRLQR